MSQGLALGRRELDRYIAAREAEWDEMPSPRRASLTMIARRLSEPGAPRTVVFGCTHNSRRSVFSQLWATVAHFRRGLSTPSFLSAGSSPRGVAAPVAWALGRAGLEVRATEPGSYMVTFGAAPPVRLWSKAFTDEALPGHFGLVVNCSALEESCPRVPGTAWRIALLYSDPRLADGTPQESTAYALTCAEIARDQLWLAAHVADGLPEG